MKNIISMLMVGVVVWIPMTSRSELITINPLTQSIELPSNIPQDVQDQIRVVLASQEGMFTWVEGFVALAIVVVAGVILYCLWRCSQMIPDPQPQQPPPPDDPAFSPVHSAIVYNLSALDSIELQVCTDLGNPQWKTVATVDNALTNITLPKSDRMFFRLMPNP